MDWLATCTLCRIDASSIRLEHVPVAFRAPAKSDGGTERSTDELQTPKANEDDFDYVG
jgi:hypothetical protein